MFRKTHLPNIARVIGMVGSGAGTLWYVSKGNKERQQWLNSLPVEKQKELYENCLLQKVGTSIGGGFGVSTIEERVYENTETMKDVPPRTPFGKK